MNEDDEATTYLGYKGYSIRKKYFSVEEQSLLRNELMVKPFVPKSSPIQPEHFHFIQNQEKRFMFHVIMEQKCMVLQMRLK